MPSARVGIECGLMQTAKQNKSRNSGRRKSRAEGGRAPLSCGREAERKLPASSSLQTPDRGFLQQLGSVSPAQLSDGLSVLRAPSHTL